MTTILLTLLLSMAGATASAHDIEVTTDGVTIYYSWTNGNTELQVSYRGDSYDAYSNEYSGSVVIPASVTYGGETYRVTSIGNSAFQYCAGLTSVTIPNSVTSIGIYAFYYCYGLTSITIPNSVTTIGEWAFDGCYGLTSIVVEGGNPVYDSRNGCNALIKTASNTLIAGCQNTIIPNTVTSIGAAAFYGCTGLTSVTIPNSVTSIARNAFGNCTGLTSITIPNSVTSIAKGAFSHCDGLTSIIVEGGNPVYDSRENCNAIIETASNTLIAGCQNTTIPNTVTIIGADAFNYCTSLTNITIPNSVTTIEERAFGGCI